MPEKKPSKEQCQKAIAQIKQMKDQKQMMNGLKQLIKAGCITQEQAQKMMGGGSKSAGGGPENRDGGSSMDNARYEQATPGTRA
tara:strand:- start:615 stop:866 length:252 start_codon:yes stop_codon:yes gene_type:complete